MQAGDAKYTICTISQDESNCASLRVPSSENVAMFFFSEKGMHHLMLLDFFFSDSQTMDGSYVFLG